MISCLCDPASEELHGGDEHSCGGRGDGLLEVLGETAVPIEPCERALDDPAARREFEAFGDVGTFDDFDGPLADPAESIAKLVASVAAIGEQVATKGSGG